MTHTAYPDTPGSVIRATRKVATLFDCRQGGGEGLVLDSWQYSDDDLQVIDLEVDRLAMLCGLPLLQPSVIEAIVRDDQRVCLVDNRMAWEKLRGLLILHHHAVAGRIESDARLMAAEFVRQGAQEVRSRTQPGTCSA